jgi:hypothetical protein
MSYALYTQLFNNFLRRFRQKHTGDVYCVRFINGMANYEFKTQPKSHRHHRGFNVHIVELQNFIMNDVVTDSPHLGGARSTVGPSTTQGGGQPTTMRN